MKSKLFVLLLLGGIVPVCALRSETADSLRNGKTYPIGEVVVTGTRHETDVRHLPMTISVVGRQKIAEGFQPSLLPTLDMWDEQLARVGAVISSVLSCVVTV